MSYAWEFGDGGTATGATASRTYAAGGTYTVELAAGAGCSDGHLSLGRAGGADIVRDGRKTENSS